MSGRIRHLDALRAFSMLFGLFVHAEMLFAALPFPLVHLASLVAANVALAKERPPNFIFVLSDDIAQGDIGVYGQELIKTPHLDNPLSSP